MKNYNYSKYNEEYFKNRSYVQPQMLQVIISQLRKHNCKNVLEVGAGAGILLKELEKAGFYVKGEDISEEASKLNRNIIVANCTDLPFEYRQFDSVLSISLIEHLTKEDGLKMLSEVNRVLKSGGLIFLVSPNTWSINHLILGRRWKPYLNDETHITFYGINQIKNLLLKKGFNKIKFRFSLESKSIEDWSVPRPFKKVLNISPRLANKVLVQSPLALFRDSFWVSAVKK